MIRRSLALASILALLLIPPAAAQDLGFPKCSVGSTETIGDLQATGAFVVVTASEANAARARQVCNQLADSGNYILLAEIPQPDETVLNVANGDLGPIHVDVIAHIDPGGFADAPSNRSVLDMIRANAMAFDLEGAVPGLVLHRTLR